MAVKVENIDGRLGRVEARLNDYAIRTRRVEDFVTVFKAVEAERDKRQAQRHQENSEKLEEIAGKVGRKTYWASIAGMVWTAVGAIVGIIAIVVMIRLAQHSDLDPLKLFTSSQSEPALSLQQHSGLPEAYQPR